MRLRIVDKNPVHTEKELRKLFEPITWSDKSSGLLVKVVYKDYKNRGDDAYSGVYHQRYYRCRDRDTRDQFYQRITLRLSRKNRKVSLFALYAHEFYHHRQWLKNKAYSEIEANKWAAKMVEKHFPGYLYRRHRMDRGYSVAYSNGRQEKRKCWVYYWKIIKTDKDIKISETIED